MSEHAEAYRRELATELGIPNRTKTQRGFSVYDSFEDAYGATVDVVQSSAAQIEGREDGPWVWIMVRGGQIADNRGSAHLGPAEARRVRDALNRWLLEEAS